MSDNKSTTIFIIVCIAISFVIHLSMMKWDDSPKAKSIILHDGTSGFAIDCNGSKFVDCEEIQGKVCPNGYVGYGGDSFRLQFVIKCALPK